MRYVESIKDLLASLAITMNVRRLKYESVRIKYGTFHKRHSGLEVLGDKRLYYMTNWVA